MRCGSVSADSFKNPLIQLIHMVTLSHSFGFRIRPKRPFSFELTVKKPAGWSLFSPFEIYEKGRLWTVTYLDGLLAGIVLSKKGTVENPEVFVRVFLETDQGAARRRRIKELVTKAIGADQELGKFYAMAKKDSILKHVIGDLYGMHDTFSPMLFSDAVLAIMLQMAPLKRSNEMMASFINNYGEVAEFDGKRIRAWPSPRKIARLTEAELARKCKVGYRSKNLVRLAKRLSEPGFPSAEELEDMNAEKAKSFLMELPGIGDYSSDIINPHGGFPIDVWSAEVFGKLFFGKEPKNNRGAVEMVKAEGIRRWGVWSWMAFFYTVQDLESLSKKIGKRLRVT